MSESDAGMTHNQGKSALSAPVISPRRRSRRRLWAFRLMAVSLPFAFLVVLELALRLFGAGRDLRLVVEVPGHPRRLTHQLNDFVDDLYYGRTKLTGPESRRFDVPKPPKTFRVVFLGASTVIGFPYPPELAFPRQAEVLLREQDRDTNFEVLNAGIVSINSFAVADLARQAAACDPDLIVIHSGHNEFYGPGGPASSALSLPPPWIRTTYLLRRLRIVQLLSALTASPAIDDDLLDILPRTLEIPRSGPVFRQAETNLRENLQLAVAACEAAGVPVVLSTVASNIRNQSPLRAVWPAGVDEKVRPEWERLVQEGEGLLKNGQPEEALRLFLQAETLCGNHARLLYRKGECLERLNRPAEARAAYIEARDEDVCRFRAPTSFSAIIREVAESAAGGRGHSGSPDRSAVTFLDVETALEQAANPAGPGSDLYLEHVHYNAAGHRELGLIFAKCIQQQIRRKEWDESRVPSSSEMDALLAVLPEDHLAALSFAKQVYDTAPFRTALDRDLEERRLMDEISQRFAALPPERREAFGDLPMNLMANELTVPLAESLMARKQFGDAWMVSEHGLIRRPWVPEAYLLSARLRDRRGDVAGARRSLESALELRPGWPAAAEYLAGLPKP